MCDNGRDSALWANRRIIMKTPICDFVRDYAKGGALKLHMPGHKGVGSLGVENLDITEIDGADSLYEASGIIAESERCASALFGCDTYYSTEGSSQCIKAMMHLITLYAREKGEKPLILAARNAHKAFSSAVALIDPDVEWLCPENMRSYLSCDVTAEELSRYFENMDRKPTALYVTSPDYLGNVLDISSIARVCHENGVLLAVDNAHGAYLKFLPVSCHPIDLGADICCDSAHKTLPVLTGGAYLHLSAEFSHLLSSSVKNSMLLFGSTSPSYLILQSLDAANAYLEGYPARLESFVEGVSALKEKLVNSGYELYGDEPLKITVKAKSYGYSGTELAKILLEKGMICEFADPDFVVLMLTPELEQNGLSVIECVMLSIPRKEAILNYMPAFHRAERTMSIREAVLSPSECLPIGECLGKVVAVSSVGCPPAVPIVVSGEIIDRETIECFKYYGIEKCNVIK